MSANAIASSIASRGDKKDSGGGNILFDDDESRHVNSESLIIPWYYNIFVITTVAYLSAIVFGTAAYTYANEWNLSDSFLYSTMMLLSVGFGSPEEDNSLSYIISIFEILFGGAVVAAALGQVIQTIDSEGDDDDDSVSKADPISTFFSYFDNHTIAFLVWLTLGIILAYNIENFDLIKSIYMAISTMSTCGNVTPGCSGDDPYDCVYVSSVVY